MLVPRGVHQVAASLQFLPNPLKVFLRVLFDTAVLTGCRRQGGSRSVGAIFVLHGLGDLILSAGAVRALHKHLRKLELRSRLFVDSVNVEFAQAYLGVDEVVGLSWLRFQHDPPYRLRVLRRLAGSGDYRMAYQPTLNRRLTVEDSLIRATGAWQRFGLEGSPHFMEPWERTWGDRLYSRLVKLPSQARHDLLAYQSFLDDLGIGHRHEPWRLQAGGSPLSPAEPFLVISNQASNHEKRWPLERFLAVAEALAASRRWRVVAVGWEEALSLPPWVVDLRGRTCSAELVRVLGDCQFLLTNDSGPLHLGVALGKPTVAVGGGGLPERYFPYPPGLGGPVEVVEKRLTCAGCAWRCGHVVQQSGVASCIDSVSTAEVQGVAEALLQRLGV